MKIQFKLEDLDLAALISSRICHDVISPVGAISNGLEVLDEEQDEEVRDYAMDLIRRSTEQASAKLQFARLAFGAGGSAGVEIGLNAIQSITQGVLDKEKFKVSWDTSIDSLPKDKAKLLLNIIAVAVTTLPRGGEIGIEVSGSSMKLSCEGRGVRQPEVFIQIIEGSLDVPLDTQSIQPYYANRLAESSNMKLNVSLVKDSVCISAVSKH